MKKIIAIVALGLAGIVYALAQTVPTVSSVSSTDLVQVIPTATPRAGNQYATMSTLSTYFSGGGGSGGVAITANSITGGDASLGITGLAGASGGAVAIAGGAGSTTTGGAVTVAAGASTSGAGSSVTISAADGAAGTNAGGNVNLVPGDAVSTGIPGKVQVNGDANLMCGSYYFTGTPAATNQVFYIANRAMIVTSISQVHSVAAGGTSTLDVTKDTGTAAPAAGTALGQAAFNLNGTANTVQNATLSATIATITLAAGDRLAVKYNHAIQSSAGVVVTACMAPL